MTPGEIDRRQFLAGAVGVGVASAMPGGVGRLLAHATSTSVSSPRVVATSTGRVLVLVTLYGGNDGLDSVVPYTNSAYFQARGLVAVPAPSVLQIGEGFGLNPALSSLKKQFDAGQVAIVHGVGYPDPNYSHFASMDIWQSASPSNESSTGWLGRWLDATGTDPMRALWLGSNIPLAFVGSKQQASSIAPTSSVSAQLPPGGADLKALYEVLERTRSADPRLQLAVAQAGTNMLAVSSEVAGALSRAPSLASNFTATAGSLGAQLAVVAQLILSGMPTQAYGVSLGGFDSHASEGVSYPGLLKQLDASVAGFFKSLEGTAAAANTVLVIYSEFGRRVVANASLGTDHGAANVAFVVGPGVKGGFYGSPPSLTQLDSNGSLVATTDFRSIYSTVLGQVMGIDPSSILGGQFPALGFL